MPQTANYIKKNLNRIYKIHVVDLSTCCLREKKRFKINIVLMYLSDSRCKIKPLVNMVVN